MSWLDSTWNFRAPIAVDNTGGATPIDASVTIPDTWDEFWDTVLSTGFDVRLVAADGVTALTFKRTTWDHPNKSAVFEIDAWAPGSSDATCQAFIYWGRVGASDAATSPTILSPKLGTIELGVPIGTVVDARREAPGTTSPSQNIHKTANETIFVYIALDGILAGRSPKAAPVLGADRHGRSVHEGQRQLPVRGAAVGAGEGHRRRCRPARHVRRDEDPHHRARRPALPARPDRRRHRGRELHARDDDPNVARAATRTPTPDQGSDPC